MPHHDPRAIERTQLPDDLVRVLESTHALVTDDTVPTWRRHAALVQLAEFAMSAGRTAQVVADIRALREAVQR